MAQNRFMHMRWFAARGPVFKAGALSVVVVIATVGTAFLASHWLRSEEESASKAPTPVSRPPVVLFRDWPSDRKPDVALLLSGEQHGYLQPCGCSRPQLGGLARRYTFLQTLLKDKGWPVVPIDLGDIADGPQHRGPQALLKYTTSMQSLKKMGYAATSFGQHEAQLPLLDALCAFALNEPQPRVLAANLVNRPPDENFPGMIKAWTVAGDGKTMPRVGIAAIVGPTVAKVISKHDKLAQFAPTMEELPRALKEMEAEKPELRVLLYQGSIEEAKACASKFPQFQVVLCQTREEEPSDRPERLKDPKDERRTLESPLVIGVGHKGRYVGVLGAYRTGKARPAFELRYQLVSLSEDFETPPGKDDTNPIMVLMEEYARTVHKDNYLALYPQRKHPLQVEFPESKYVGSQKCIQCHEEAAKVWKNSGHAHAYQSLEKATRPSLRQFDGECIVCHTVGFGYDTGFKNEKDTPRLKDVGCESCHGPGSLHANRTFAKDAKQNARLLALLNPHKPKPDETPEETRRRLNLIDQSCQKCHDTDNDVHWNFDKKWPKIIHREAQE